MSTITNSLLLAIPFGALIGLILTALFFSPVMGFLDAIPGALYFLGLGFLPFAWAAQRRAVLLQEP